MKNQINLEALARLVRSNLWTLENALAYLHANGEGHQAMVLVTMLTGRINKEIV